MLVLEEVLRLITHLPTVLFTVPLVLSVLYWLFVVVGVADVDLLGGADGALEGAAEGAVEGAAEGVIEGAAEGAAEGGADAAAEAAEGADGPAAAPAVSGQNPIAWLFSVLKLRSAPATVVLSLFTLFGWTLSGMGMHFLGDLPLPGWAIGTVVFAGASLTSLFLTSAAIRPVAPLFDYDTHHSESHLVGKTARLKRKSRGRGQAVLHDDGRELILNVRWRPAIELPAKAELLIIDYEADAGYYLAEPEQKLLEAKRTPKVRSAEQVAGHVETVER